MAEVVSKSKARAFKLVALLLPLLLLGAVGEVYARLKLHPNIMDERNLAYAYDPALGWFPKKNTEQDFIGSRRIHVRHNSRGFRDAERGPKTKPRLVFIGDSFVWGYDVELAERFTELIQARLPDWEVVNLGVSGYGTDQEYLLLQQQLDHYRPDVVVLLFHTSDTDDNTSNLRYSGYQKPYFTVEQGKLQLHNSPVPLSINYYYTRHPWLFLHSDFVRAAAKFIYLYVPPRLKRVPDPTAPLLTAVRDLVQSKGARFAVAFEHENQPLLEHCRRESIPCCLALSDDRYPEYGKHWTPAGNRKVAEDIYNFLHASALLNLGPTR